MKLHDAPRSVARLAIAEYEARKAGNFALADKLQAERWQLAMGMVVCSENAKDAP